MTVYVFFFQNSKNKAMMTHEIMCFWLVYLFLLLL